MHRAHFAWMIVAAIGLIPGSALAQGAARPNLTGTWRFTVNSDAGSGTPTATLRQQGDTLSGQYSSQVFGEQQLKGSVKDREFSLEFTASIEGTTLTVTYKGTIASADSLHGTVALGSLGSGTFTAKRQPPAQELPAFDRGRLHGRAESRSVRLRMARPERPRTSA